MRTTIELPQVGESVTEGVIGKWLVEPGQRVEKYDALVEVVTDKVSMDAPSPYAGVFVRALVEEGETVPMGDPICEMEIDAAEPAEEPAPRPSPIGRGSAEAEADVSAAPQEAEAVDVPSPQPSPIGRGSDEAEGDDGAAPQEAEAAEQGESVAADAESDAEEQGESVVADAESDAEEQGESVAADAESDAEEQGESVVAAAESAAEEHGESVAADAESAAEEQGDTGRVGGAWAMPAAQNEQVGGDSEGAAQAVADAAPQAEGDAAGDAGDSAPGSEGAEVDAEKPASEHPFEFVGSVRSVGPTGSGERGEGRPDAAQEAAVAAATEPAAQEEAADSAATEPVAQEEAIATATEPAAQEATAAAAKESAAQEEAVVAATEPAVQEAAAAAAEEPAPSRAAAEPDRRHVVSPLVARLSAQYGIDLSTVRGTGTGGRVTSQDLLNAVSAAEARRAAEEAAASEQTEAVAPPAPPSPIGSEEGEPAPQPSPTGKGSAEADEGAAPQEAEAAAPVAHPQEDEAAPAAESAEQAEAVEQGAPPQEESAAPVAAASDEAEFVAPGAPPQEEGGAPVAAAAEQADDGVSLLPVTPIRRAIAEHMARSASEIPAAWAMVEADATGLVRARDARKEAFERERGMPLTYLPFLANAAAQALRERPKLNARWDDGRIILNNRVNLSVAVATEAGLMVPVLRDADTLSVEETAVALRRLTEAARNGALTLDDVQGGTFTLNNTGALGSVVSVPIINHPQAAILTTEAIVKRPVVIHGDAIAARSMMNLCISFDHRVCDGADAAGFLRAVKDRLEALDESAALG